MQNTKPKPQFRFFTDPSHGWLEVSSSEFLKSKANISNYSYYCPDRGMIYLEEDRDAFNFLKAMGYLTQDKKGKWIQHHDEVCIHTNDASFVRSLQPIAAAIWNGDAA